MKRTRHIQRVKKLMLHALNEAIKTGFLPSASGSSDITAAEGTEITVGGRNTVINRNCTQEGDVQFSVWWDYTPERCGRFLRDGVLRDLRGAIPDVSSSTRQRITGVCASCYLCITEEGGIRLSREGKMTVTYVRTDMVHFLDDLPDVEPVGYSVPGTL
ncbi:TPA: hypothetical protein H2W01_004480 [Salmonella enterica]|nr:hypothetical protein [Salmonella enterica]